ncbi:MAG: methyltransferase family protein [Archangium sp.]
MTKRSNRGVLHHVLGTLTDAAMCEGDEFISPFFERFWDHVFGAPHARGHSHFGSHRYRRPASAPCPYRNSARNFRSGPSVFNCMTRHLTSTALVTFFFASALGLRPLLHRIRTGKWGMNGLSGRVGSLEWWGGATFILSILLTPLALALPAFDSPSQGMSLVVAIAGLVLTLVAQAGMGTSWRIGVDVNEQTSLVTGGFFALVRNPIFTGMLTFAFGLATLWPNVASLAAALTLFIAVELQVRFVEEPYLRSLHGTAWGDWAARVGRFVPLLGRVR